MILAVASSRADESTRLLLQAPGTSVQGLEAAVADNPDDVRVPVALGQAHVAAKNPDAAVAVLRRAVEADAMFAPARLTLGNALNEKGIANLILQQGVPKINAKKDQADETTQSGLWFDVANKHFEIAVGLAPDDAYSWLTWGKALLARNPPNPLGLATIDPQPALDPEPALEKMRTAIGLAPDDLEITKTLAGTLGMYGLAYELFARRGPRASPPSWLPEDVDLEALGHAYL